MTKQMEKLNENVWFNLAVKLVLTITVPLVAYVHFTSMEQVKANNANIAKHEASEGHPTIVERVNGISKTLDKRMTDLETTVKQNSTDLRNVLIKQQGLEATMNEQRATTQEILKTVKRGAQ